MKEGLFIGKKKIHILILRRKGHLVNNCRSSLTNFKSFQLLKLRGNKIIIKMRGAVGQVNKLMNYI